MLSLKTRIPQLAASLILIIFTISLCYQFRHHLPVGWDVFYHLRVLELINESGNLINFDPISAGGRVHSYLPGYYALVQSLALSTRQNPVDASRIISPFFGVLSALAFLKWRKLTIPSVCALALYCLQAGTMDIFITAGMPRAPAYLLLLLAISSSSEILALFSIIIGFLRPSTLLLLGIFELISGVLNKKIKRPLLVMLGLLPSIFWYTLVPRTISLPDWGFGADLNFLQSMIDFRTIPLLLLGIGMNAGTLWTITFLLMTKYSFLPRRFTYPLIVSGAVIAETGAERIKSEKLQTAVLAVLVIVLVHGSWNFWTTIGPNIKFEDLNSMYWLKENAKSGVLAHRDLSTVWVLYYAKRPTVLDGYSEALENAQERMSDVLGALESQELEKTAEAGKKYGLKYLTYNLAENWTFKAEINKYDAWETLCENWYSKVKFIP